MGCRKQASSEGKRQEAAALQSRPVREQPLFAVMLQDGNERPTFSRAVVGVGWKALFGYSHSCWANRTG